MARSLEEIQKDYNVKCAELGQAIYRIEALDMEVRGTEKQVEKFKRDLKKLNLEAAQASGKPVTEDEAKELSDEPATES